ncbi:hypothetical protein [Azospirillum lipoferum]|uniref:Uncharacterized protein n=1 Tax=Azospirillum lipoferum (strain 4B) TaxID=862719 RepID=G7ZIS3_AZOL4|nr:hypothetical protein [Azospirillum lipoferum]CBS91611.1 conserved protein of unknown function [Azospirillum lipoferum 4B]
MYYAEALEPMVGFLRSIGIGVEYGEGAKGGFLPGVNIHAGVIHVDPDTLVGSGDVLHEAGHIAVVPRAYWPRLNRDLQGDARAQVAAAEQAGDPAAVHLRRAAESGELMAQAWSYAAALHLGYSPACVFFPGSYYHEPYEGDHPTHVWLESGTHFGPVMLAQAGITGFSGIVGAAWNNGLPPFPQMSRWTVD